MNANYLELQRKLYGDNFAYDKLNLPCDIQGWGSNHPFFQKLIEEYQPKIIVEVGVWKGASVIHMAKIIKKLGLDTIIIAVDTWLGSKELWINDKWRGGLRLDNGLPHTYDQFISNCQSMNVLDMIIPMPIDSINASLIMRHKNISFDLIHIDAGHDYDSVTQDINNWYEVLNCGGVMLFDDYRLDGGWPGVKLAVDTFCLKRKIKLLNIDSQKCYFIKK